MTFALQPGDPPWLVKAASYIGFHETGNNRGIGEFITLAGFGNQGDAWCSIFANGMLRATGFATTGSALARSFEHSANFVRLDKPKRGCIVTYWRSSQSSGSGHVDFWTGVDPEGRILGLGGNQSDGVNVAPQDPEHVTGYWWPAQADTQLQPQTATSAPAASNFAACLPLLLVSEGGNDDDPRDPGGRTSRGITQREYDLWRRSHPDLPSDVWKAPDAQVSAIYRANYWNALQCDALPDGVDYAVFDYGVNSGVSRSAKLLQSLVGTDQDGEIGPLTIAATSKADPVTLINQFCDRRLAFLQSLSTWGTFGRGWSSRVARVRADSLNFAAKGKPKMTDPQTTTAPDTTTKPGVTVWPPALTSKIDIAPLFRFVADHKDEGAQLLASLYGIFKIAHPDGSLPLPTAPAAPAPAQAAPAATGAPNSLIASLVALIGLIGAMGGGLVGLPDLSLLGLPKLPSATTAGTVSTLITLITTVIGALGGFGGLAKSLPRLQSPIAPAAPPKS